MTGFGRMERSVGDKTFLIDIKSLNGKQFELNLKMPAFLKPFEFEIRNILSKNLNRGSIDCTISLKETGSAKPVSINTNLAKAYFKPISELSEALKLDSAHVLSTLLKLPEVITPTGETLTDDEWKEFQSVLISAIDELNSHRTEEGKSLQVDLVLRIANILKHQEAISVLEPRRKIKIKEGLVKILEENVGKENYDSNRMEQEIIYYIEKSISAKSRYDLKIIANTL